MNSGSEKSQDVFSTYSDRYRVYCIVFLALFSLAAIVLWAAAVIVADNLENMLFSGTILVFTIYVSIKFALENLKVYLAKASFTREGIICTRLGKQLKSLRWDEISEIACVGYKRPKSETTYYLLFSGHELTDEEKKKSVELAGLKNDIVVVKYKEKTVQQLREIHDFSFADERRRDGIRE